MPENPNYRQLRAAGQVPAAGRVGEAIPLGVSKVPTAELRRKVLRRLDIDLASARPRNNPIRLDAVGNVLACMKTSFVTDEFEVRLNGEGDWIPFGPGTQLYGTPFEFLEVAVVGSGLSISATLIYMTDYPGDRALLRYR